MTRTTDHLALAKEALQIAESSDSKREGYKKAAQHIVAYKKHSGSSDAAIAELMGIAPERVTALRNWSKSGYKAETPWRKPGKDESAQRAHARRFLRDADAATLRQAVKDLPQHRKEEIAQAVDDDRREFHERAREGHERRDTERRQRHSLRYIQAEGHLARAQREIRAATDEARAVEFAADEQEMLEERLAEVRREVEVAELAISGATDIDWDAEFARVQRG